ncbi:MAG: GH3 auxin-responsive promoter family protein [Bacteroidetes bacterium]|nr:GH3 auxin-responsive promoter family protein [Bacteroidota bacterium]MDA1119201.1 GH3 auxin-responsive promoter family protein [Bacteroidota bacterium]
MGIRSVFGRPFSLYIRQQNKKWTLEPFGFQDNILKSIVSRAADTVFGKDHDFHSIKNYDDFRLKVPIRDYETLKPYINRAVDGENDILWPGQPAYFCKTSGTTSGTKYIPLTKESIPNHFNSARNALFLYLLETGNYRILDGKLIFLSGSPVLEEKNGIKIGRLSGIVNHHIPAWLRSNQMPSYETNSIDDWEQKVDQIVAETIDKDMRLISGIPPWVQMYFDRLKAKSGKKIKDLFPNFSLFMYGGVNFEPYRVRLFESIGTEIDSIETYPASEGFIAYQDTQTDEGLLLLLDSGIFFEFIPADEYFLDNPTRLNIEEVETGINYVLIINSNAGLWGYSIGDTIKFVSKNPYRIVVTGRIIHFISAFGEHVITEEVEKAMKITMENHHEVELIEFTVAPNVTPEEGLPHHEWYIEFANPPDNWNDFIKTLDQTLCDSNSYYNDLITGNILSQLKIVEVRRNTFINYMKSIGKLGGQNKVPRLSNDRKIAEKLQTYRKT